LPSFGYQLRAGGSYGTRCRDGLAASRQNLEELSMFSKLVLAALATLLVTATPQVATAAPAFAGGGLGSLELQSPIENVHYYGYRGYGGYGGYGRGYGYYGGYGRGYYGGGYGYYGRGYYGGYGRGYYGYGRGYY
jgi:hypothetical protein